MNKLDTLLYWYTLTFSTALILTALGNGFTLTNLTTVAFFLPVPTFLLLQILKRYYLWKQVSVVNPHQPTVTFPLKSFLTQSNPAFIITLMLFLTSLIISLIRAL